MCKRIILQFIILLGSRIWKPFIYLQILELIFRAFFWYQYQFSLKHVDRTVRTQSEQNQ